MKIVLSLGVRRIAALPGFAQTAAGARAKSPWTLGKVDVHGVADGYYSLNFHHPRSALQAIRRS